MSATREAYRAAYIEARPFAEEAIRRQIAACKVRPCDFEHQVGIWQKYAAFECVSRGLAIEQIAAVQVPGFRLSQVEGLAA